MSLLIFIETESVKNKSHYLSDISYMNKNYFSCLIIALLGFGCRSEHPESYDLLISNVNLIDGSGTSMQENISIGIKDGKIVAIDSAVGNSQAEVIDATGKWVIPGLFDCHAHTTNYRIDLPHYIHYGVTSIFVTGGSKCTNAYYDTLRSLGNQDSLPAPLVFHTSQHFSMEGRHPSKTYPSNDWRDGESIFYLKDTTQIESLVKQVSQHPIVGIKLTIEDGPAPPFVKRMPLSFIKKTVQEGKKYGLEVFGHVSDNTELEMAIRSGVQNVLHFTGVDIIPEDVEQQLLLADFRKTNPSWVTTLMIDKSFLYPLYPEWFDAEHLLPAYKKIGAQITPELTELASLHAHILKRDYGLEEIGLVNFVRPQAQDIDYLSDLGFNLVLGTDACNRFNFHGYSLNEEMQLLDLGGLKPLEIIKMGTVNAAKMLGVIDSLGSIEVGKKANMVLLNKNPLTSISNTLEIHQVIKNGAIQNRVIE